MGIMVIQGCKVWEIFQAYKVVQGGSASSVTSN